MKKLSPLHLSDEQSTALQQLVHRGAAPARVQTRARTLLLLAQDQPPAAVAANLLISPATVYRIRARYVQDGLAAALYDQPRPGQPPTITGDVEAHLTL